MGNFHFGRTPGLTKAEIVAYNCGKRLQREQDDSIPAVASVGFLPPELLTNEERTVFSTTNLDRWWRAWWHGWNDGMEDDQ